jgi:hypothetical protein
MAEGTMVSLALFAWLAGFNPYIRGGIGLWKLGGSIGNLLKRYGLGGGGGGNDAHKMGMYDPNFNYGGSDPIQNGFGGPGAMEGGPFGGLPQGFTEGNRDYGDGPNQFTQTGGAPSFTGPGFTGPQWSPGGSIFGGTTNLAVNGGGNIGNSRRRWHNQSRRAQVALPRASWFYNGPHTRGNGHSTDSPEGLGMLRYTPQQHAYMQMMLNQRGGGPGEAGMGGGTRSLSRHTPGKQNV